MGLIDTIDTQIAMWFSSMYDFHGICLCVVLFMLQLPSHWCLYDYKQINMKGLDGIQGPIYVGTGCVFRRQALYGFDAPKKKKTKRMTCNCWPKWCLFCCGLRKNRKSKTTDKKKKNREASKQIHALEYIEEGTKGNQNKSSVSFSFSSLLNTFLFLSFS